MVSHIKCRTENSNDKNPDNYNINIPFMNIFHACSVQYRSNLSEKPIDSYDRYDSEAATFT